jgi:Ca-activated chloride channel family protein
VADIIFHNPDLLWLLALLPVLIVLRGRTGRAAAIEFSSVAIARRVSAAARSRAGGLLFSLRLLGLAALVVALARPQLPQGHEQVEASGIDIVLALDLSGSMSSVDLSMDNEHLVTRVDAAKQVLRDFIEKRPNDRIGMVVFAGNPYLVSPLTLNHDWLLQNLERVHLNLIEDGTAIGSALGMASNRLRDLPSKSRVIILLTDGDNNCGSISPIAAAEAAAAYNIKIYTIGVGTEGGLWPRVDDQGRLLKDDYGRLVIYTDDNGNPIPVDGIDTDDLQRIANITGGTFYRAKDVTQLQRIYSQIDQEQKSVALLRHFSTYQELFYWPALLGLGLVGFEQWLAQTRLRRLP